MSPEERREHNLAVLRDEETRCVEILRSCPGCGCEDRTKPPTEDCAHRWHRQAVDP